MLIILVSMIASLLLGALAFIAIVVWSDFDATVRMVKLHWYWLRMTYIHWQLGRLRTKLQTTITNG